MYVVGSKTSEGKTGGYITSNAKADLFELFSLDLLLPILLASVI